MAPLDSELRHAHGHRHEIAGESPCPAGRPGADDKTERDVVRADVTADVVLLVGKDLVQYGQIRVLPRIKRFLEALLALFDGIFKIIGHSHLNIRGGKGVRSGLFC